MDHRLFLKSEFIELDLTEVLQQSPIVLLGVTAAAEAQLANLKAPTVFDLAHAAIFGNAARIVDAAANPASIIAKQGAVPSDVLDDAALAIPLSDLPASSVRNLVGIGDQNGPAIESALSIASIRDLATWPPFVAARALVGACLNPFQAAGYDPEAPAELLPRTGQHATQKVVYRKTLLIESKPKSPADWDGSTLDLSVLDELGFKDVAFGAILTFHQRWTPRRLALGSLLHSLPLGPGESTRTAVVDWARRMAASSREDASQAEDLRNSMSSSTAITEITSAVATQVQVGSSGTASAAASESTGGIAFFGIGIGGGSQSSNVGVAATYSVSNTNRSETASALQSISSHSHQATALARQKRAAVVTEVSQQESESLTTRTVTNYNHMHALSIQYYEAVQIYETETVLAGVERCLFVPMLKINFRRESNIRRFLRVLIRSALDARTRDLLVQYRDTLVLEHSPDRFADSDLTAFAEAIAAQPPFPGTDRLSMLGAEITGRLQLQLFRSRIAELRRRVASNYGAGVRAGLIEGFDRNSLLGLTIDRGAVLNGASWPEASGIAAVHLHLEDGSRIRLTEPAEMSASEILAQELSAAVPIDSIRRLEVEFTQDGPSSARFRIANLHVQLAVRGRPFWLDASFVHVEGDPAAVTVFGVSEPVDLEEIGDRLMDHQLHYSQQVWLHANSQALVMQLAPFTLTIGGKTLHVVDYLDPKPVTVAGNYVAFKFKYEDDAAWKEWVARERKGSIPRYDLLPVPSGGVFCEAVPGEFNSAEKLDATRFWRWQDSTIPFSAPDIAALSAGEHQRIGAPTPGAIQVSDVVKLQPLQELPTGLATSKELLAALMAENVFKNMGGVDVTAKLLEAAQAAAAAGDKATQEQLLETVKGVMSAFQGLATSFLASPDGVKNLTQLGTIFNSLASSGGTASAGAAAAPAAAGTAAELAATVGPLVAEIAPLVLV